MDFLGIGPLEMVILLVVALFVFGPEKAVRAARTLGRLSRQLTKSTLEITRSIEAEVDAVSKPTVSAENSGNTTSSTSASISITTAPAREEGRKITSGSS